MAVKVTAVHEAAPAVSQSTPPVAHAGSPTAQSKTRDTVTNYKVYAKSDFVYWAQIAIRKQMVQFPERFSADILASAESKRKYAKEFAEHMLDKLANEQVKVLNETTADTLLSLQPSVKPSIAGLYEVLYVGGKPLHAAPVAASPAPAATQTQRPPFRGC